MINLKKNAIIILTLSSILPVQNWFKIINTTKNVPYLINIITYILIFTLILSKIV